MVKPKLLRHSKEARLETSPAAVDAFGGYNLLKCLLIPFLKGYIALTAPKRTD